MTLGFGISIRKILITIDLPYLGIGIEALHVGHGGVSSALIIGIMIIHREVHIGHVQKRRTTKIAADIQSGKRLAESLQRREIAALEQRLCKRIGESAANKRTIDAVGLIIGRVSRLSCYDDTLPLKHRLGRRIHEIADIQMVRVGLFILEHRFHGINIDAHWRITIAKP